MTTSQSALTLLALSTANLAHPASATARHPQPVPSRALPAPTRTLTIVKSKAPWYAANFLLVREFRKLVPVYQQIDGLEFKAFSSIVTPAGKFFGGIYCWTSEAQARAWYSPTWFADVERKRGHRPSVEYYALVDEVIFAGDAPAPGRGERRCVTVFAHALTPAQRPQCLRPQPGLLRTYLVREPQGQEGTLLLFATAGSAANFLKQSAGSCTYEWFMTPVLVDNAPHAR